MPEIISDIERQQIQIVETAPDVTPEGGTGITAEEQVTRITVDGQVVTIAAEEVTQQVTVEEIQTTVVELLQETTVRVTESALPGSLGALSNVDPAVDSQEHPVGLRYSTVAGQWEAEPVEEFRFADSSTTSGVYYIGYAEPGAVESESVWQVLRLTKTSTSAKTEFADGDARYIKVWDDREGYSY